jgi:hypothetical protein
MFDIVSSNKKLDEISQLESNWDGYDSPPIDQTLIEKVRNFLKEKEKENIFKYKGMNVSADSSIILRLEKGNTSYLYEFDVDGTGMMLSEEGKKPRFFDI